jgi:hypothetical protein
MIKIFELITGDAEEVKHHIESLENFSGWQFGKKYNDQINKMLSRDDLMKHIGFVTYQQNTPEGVVIHGAFVAITKPWRFIDAYKA